MHSETVACRTESPHWGTGQGPGLREVKVLEVPEAHPLGVSHLRGLIGRIQKKEILMQTRSLCTHVSIALVSVFHPPSIF